MFLQFFCWCCVLFHYGYGYYSVNNEDNATQPIEVWNVDIIGNELEHLRNRCLSSSFQRDDRQKVERKRKEIVKLVMDPNATVLCDQREHNVCYVLILFKSSEIFLKGLSETNLTIAFVHHFHPEKSDDRRFTCIKIADWNLANKEQIIFLGLRPDGNFKRAEIYVHAFTAGEVYEQTIFLQSPRYCDAEGICPLQRFVYSDSTTLQGRDQIYVSKYAAPEPQTPVIFHLETKTLPGEKWEIVKTFLDTNEMIETLSTHMPRFYRISTQPRTIGELVNVYKAETIAAAVSICIGLVISVAVLLWYLSRPQRKTIIVIYCQCKQHVVIADAMRKLWRFLEKHCFMHVEEISIISDGESNLMETENFMGRKKEHDFILYVPFPAIEDHDRLFESDIHQLCDQYKTSKNKIEVLLPFNENVNVIGSDWSRNSYRHFRFLEEVALFVKHVHPCYFPSCLEKYLRRDLWGPALEDKLSENTYTNDHLREVINQKFGIYGSFDKTQLGLPTNINLDEISF